MNDIIDFIFNNVALVWALIVSNWVLAFGVLLLLMNWVISIYNGSTRQ